MTAILAGASGLEADRTPAEADEPLVTRRIHGRNFTDVEKFYPDNLKILGRVLESVPELSDLKQRRLSGLNLKRGNSFVSAGRMNEAKRAYRTAWGHDRSNLRALAGLLLSHGGPLGGKLAGLWFGRGVEG